MPTSTSRTHAVAAATAAALLPIMGVAFVAYLVIGLAMPVLPLHVRQGLSTFVVGLVAGSQFVATLTSRPWAGHYADRRGAKPAVITGLGVVSGVHLHGGPAPVRRFLPELIDLVRNDKTTPARSST